MHRPMPDAFAAVRDLVEQVTDVPAEEIDADSRFETLDNWTSFAALRLLTEIEDRFGIRLDLRAYLASGRVGELVAMVSAEVSASSER